MPLPSFGSALTAADPGSIEKEKHMDMVVHFLMEALSSLLTL